ncbi:MAG: sigma 54-interacting transcriptional regulator [Polyangiaceae bacterium]|nr:sigma 54-interacting transcriptional regulator [Polyangiaceae bacterium]
MPEGTFVLVARGAHGESSIEVDGGSPSRLYVGKSASCDLVIDDPEVSRRHLAIELVGAHLRVTDLGSTNGTFVDRLRINEVLLSGGETLRLGGTTIAVVRKADGMPRIPAGGSSFGRLLGQSRAMRRLYPLCERLAASNVPVMIEGETGTGKEVLAEALHEQGPRAAGPFVVFDCTTVPASLVESELFGAERGAFTGAVRDRPGVFEQADGGTLFIDEIGDLELSLQAKLLRAVERGEVRRVGSDRWLHVDVRILCATRRDLDRQVQEGRFRDDLFHRLAVARIELPPLRQRSADIEILARHFWTQAGAAGEPPDDVLGRWTEEPFPGNVRELKNAVWRHIAIGAEAALPPDEAEATSARRPLSGTDFIDRVIERDPTLAAGRAEVVAEYERRFLERVLERHGGNVSRAAAATGVARRHLQRLRAKSR